MAAAEASAPSPTLLVLVAVVHAVQHIGVLFLHRSTSYLHARRDFALVHTELGSQDLELLDRFPALQLLIALPNKSFDQVVNFLRAGKFFDRRIAQPLILRPTLDRL